MWYHYLWWIPVALIMYSGLAYTSMKNSEAAALDSSSVKWTIVVWLVTVIPLWAVVSRLYPKTELNFVGALYDIVLLVAYQTTLIYLGCSDHFTTGQWIGLSLIGLGFLVFKVT